MGYGGFEGEEAGGAAMGSGFRKDGLVFNGKEFKQKFRIDKAKINRF